MRTTLAIDDDVLKVAKLLAVRHAESVGCVISVLALKGLRSMSAKKRGEFPVFSVKRTARPITLNDVKRSEDERSAHLNKALTGMWSPAQLKAVLAPHYDVVALRERERPGRK